MIVSLGTSICNPDSKSWFYLLPKLVCEFSPDRERKGQNLNYTTLSRVGS